MRWNIETYATAPRTIGLRAMREKAIYSEYAVSSSCGVSGLFPETSTFVTGSRRSWFSNRIAVISGGASGIGLAAARRLVSGGATVVLWDIDEKALAKARADFEQSSAVNVDRVDVTESTAVADAADKVAREFGKIDILVASAGITGPNCTAWEYPLQAWERVLRINLDGVMHCCRAVIPHMLRTGYGRIVTVASIGGKEGNARASAYAASKGGVIAFTKALGKELVQTEIRVNTICPAAIETELLGQMDPEFVASLRSKIPLGRFGRADEVASLIGWMCSEECSFCTGAVFDSSGGRATY
jgi:NAD(P)-dependent dehydrogenase (short-subunit alcohol dehydrogenase family)